MENSIKEDIKIVENYLTNSAINEIDSNFFKNGGWEVVDLEIPKAIKHILSDYKRVLKENEELKKLHIQDNKHLDFIMEHSISVQKVKDKIEEILNNGEYRIIFEGDAEFPDEATCIDAQKYIKLEKLQELLEGRE